jgi:hypothetical protein
MSNKPVEKTKKTRHVSSPDRRSDANLSRGMYLPLDRREIRNEPVLSRVFRGQHWPHVVDDEVRAYGDRHFERMHET